MIQFTTIRHPAMSNSVHSRAARTLLMLASFSVLGLPSLAARTAPSSQVQATQPQNIQAQRQTQNNGVPGQDQTNPGPNQRDQGQVGQRGPADRLANLEVSYYSGDPLKGGKLISTIKLTPPPQTAAPTQGQPAGQHQNPITAQAPKSATFAVIKDARGGARIIDLAQMNQLMESQGGRSALPPQDGTPPQR